MLKKQFPSRKDYKGFTLIEVITFIFIFTLTMGIISGTILMLYRAHAYTWEQSIAIDEARKGIETMVREIRGASHGEDGSYTIWRTENYEFGFYSDIDRDGDSEKVRYFLEGTNFKKGIIKATGTPPLYPTTSEKIFLISQYVRNSPPIFRYFDRKGKELPYPARKKDTTIMEVFLVINVDPNRPPHNFELRSNVQIRNLKREF